MTTHTVRQHDTAPPATDTFLDASGSPVDLTGATVRFHMATWDLSMVVIPSGTVTAIGGGALDATGTMQYAWQAADVANRGVFRAEWQATLPNGAIRTYPTEEYAVVEITADLA